MWRTWSRSAPAKRGTTPFNKPRFPRPPPRGRWRAAPEGSAARHHPCRFAAVPSVGGAKGSAQVVLPLQRRGGAKRRGGAAIRKRTAARKSHPPPTQSPPRGAGRGRGEVGAEGLQPVLMNARTSSGACGRHLPHFVGKAKTRDEGSNTPPLRRRPFFRKRGRGNKDAAQNLFKPPPRRRGAGGSERWITERHQKNAHPRPCFGAWGWARTIGSFIPSRS